jgi:hypothetical protein
LDVGLTVPRVDKSASYEIFYMALDIDGFFGTAIVEENGHEIWHMEYILEKWDEVV